MVLYIVKDGVENCIFFIWLLEGFFTSVKYFAELPSFGRLMSEKWDTITQNARFCYGFSASCLLWPKNALMVKRKTGWFVGIFPYRWCYKAMVLSRQ